MLSDLDFKALVESIDAMTTAIYSERDREILKIALRIADRLQRGEVSEGMSRQGSRILIDQRYKKFPYAEDARRCFRAMSQQLIKEVCDEK